ncbi:MAG TPA: hypothetical protein VFA27_04090 [Vicinamibacterales bacterium]|nr:hypothetical protein [Vicinamibacterales bacterium]
MMRSLTTTDSASVLRWVMMRGSRAVTCEIRTASRGGFDVCVIPLWDVHAATIEPFDRAAAAMRRHAEIAMAFRQSGWIVARQTRGRATEVAA